MLIHALRLASNEFFGLFAFGLGCGLDCFFFALDLDIGGTFVVLDAVGPFDFDLAGFVFVYFVCFVCFGGLETDDVDSLTTTAGTIG